MSSYTGVKTFKYGPFLVHPVRNTLCNAEQHVSTVIRNKCSAPLYNKDAAQSSKATNNEERP